MTPAVAPFQCFRDHAPVEAVLLLSLAVVLGVAGYLSVRGPRKPVRTTPRASAQTVFEAAETLMQEGRYTEAADKYVAAGAYRFAATALSKAGDPAGAASLLERAGHHEAAAWILEEMGEYERAAAIYQQSGEFEDLPRAAEALMLAGQYARAGAILESYGDFVRAVEVYGRLDEHDPPDRLLITLERALRSLAPGDERRDEIIDRIVLESGRLGALERAAFMLEAAEEYMHAARLFEENLDMPARAAEIHEVHGDLRRAAQLHRQAGAPEIAAALFYEAGAPLDTLDVPRARVLTIAIGRARFRGDELRAAELEALLESLLASDPDAISTSEEPVDAGMLLGTQMSEPGKSWVVGLQDEDRTLAGEGALERMSTGLGVLDTSALVSDAGVSLPGEDTEEEETVSDEDSLIRAVERGMVEPNRSTVDVSSDAESRYRLEELIGRGGMGAVVRAHDCLLDRPVAMKLLPILKHEDNAQLMEAFFHREARAAARLAHPGIVTIYDFGRYRGRYFISMEYVVGEPLSHQIRRRTLHLDRALEVAVEMLDAVEFAHRQGVVHRDLKPANILIAHDGRAKVADFGLAHLVAEGDPHGAMVVGTPAYMAPEQLRGDASRQSDIFSVGVSLYEMLTGKRPGFGQDLPMRAKRIASPREVDDAISEVLSTAVMECLARDPSHRPSNLKLLQYVIGCELEELRRG